MRWAAFIPTRGNSASCAASAVLMLTTPSGVAPDGVSAAKAAAPTVAMKNAMRKMGRDFRMVFFLLSFLGVVSFGCFGSRSHETVDRFPFTFHVGPLANRTTSFSRQCTLQSDGHVARGAKL